MALKTDNKIFLSWDDVNDAVDDICNKIRHDQPNIDSVHGIARGGLIPAVLISHKLGLPWTAVLHYKPHTSCFQPNIWSEIHEGDEWVIYPWETKDSKPIQDYLANGAKEWRDKADEYYKSK